MKLDPAGDGGAARNNLDSELLQHLHSWPSYVVFGLTIISTILAFSGGNSPADRRLRKALVGLTGATFAQIAIGLYQARNGLPELAVGIHMVLAAVLVALVVTAWLSTREDPESVPGAGQSRQRETAASNS